MSRGDDNVVYLLWDGRVLKPEMAHDYERCARFKVGERVKAELRKPRRIKTLNTYWAVLATVVDATGCCPTSRHLDQLVKLKLGYVTHIVLPNGDAAMVPDSIAFDSMDEVAFSDFMTRAFAYLSELFGFDVFQATKDAHQ